MDVENFYNDTDESFHEEGEEEERANTTLPQHSFNSTGLLQPKEKLQLLEQELNDELETIKEERDELLRKNEILQQQLQTAIQHRRSILENITNAFFFIDRQWRFLYLNAQAEKLLARSRQELVGRNLWDEFPAAVGSVFFENFHRAFEKGETVNFDGYFPPLASWFEVHVYSSQEGLSIYFNDINDKKKAQQEFEQQQLQLSTILDSTAEGIFGVDLGGKCTFINHSALKLLGYSENECLGQLMHNLVHHTRPDGTPYPFKDCPIQQSLLSGKSVKLQEEILWHNDGRVLPTLYSCSPIVEKERIVGSVVTIIDLQEHKSAQALLAESEGRFRAIWEATSDAVALSDAQGTVITANSAYFALYGYRPEEIVGQHYSVIFAPEARKAARESYNQVFNGPKTVQAYEAEITRPDGTRRFVEASYDFISHNGQRTAMVSVVRDITERKQLELERNSLLAQLQAEQARLTALIENVPTGIFLAQAPSGQIAMANQKAKLMLGLPNLLSRIEEEYGNSDGKSKLKENGEGGGGDYDKLWSWYDFKGQRLDRSHWPLARALKGETVQGEELLVERRDGTKVFFWINAIPLRAQSPAGEVVQVIITLNDISEQKRAENNERFLSDFAEKLLPLAQEEKVYQNAATMLGRFLKVDRCFFGTFDFATSQTAIHYNYCKGKSSKVIDKDQDKSLGLEGNYNLKRVNPKVLSQLKAGKPVVIGEYQTGLSELEAELHTLFFNYKAECFKGQTLLIVPLLRQGSLEMTVGINLPTQNHKRRRKWQWHKEEIVLLRSVLERVWLAAQNARLYQKAQEVAVLEERTRIARELHDSLQQEFYGIQLSANITLALLKSQPGSSLSKVTEQLEETVLLAEGGLVELRSLIFDLMPEALKKQGLVTGLQNQVQTLKARHRLTVRSELGSEPPVKDELKEVVYFIAREALFNIVKHAGASGVEIKLVWSQEKSYLELSVSDNGSGFEPAKAISGHYGLESIKERTTKAGGTVSIQSHKGQGTFIQAVFPV